jgi:hypothetical protein
VVGAELVALTMSTTSGGLLTAKPLEEGSIESTLAGVGLPLMFLDVRMARQNKEALTWLSTRRSVNANVSSQTLITLSTAVDAFFFLDTLTPTILSSDKAPSRVGRRHDRALQRLEVSDRPISDITRYTTWNPGRAASRGCALLGRRRRSCGRRSGPERCCKGLCRTLWTCASQAQASVLEFKFLIFREYNSDEEIPRGNLTLPNQSLYCM